MKKFFKITLIIIFTTMFIYSGCKILQSKNGRSNSSLMNNNLTSIDVFGMGVPSGIVTDTDAFLQELENKNNNVITEDASSDETTDFETEASDVDEPNMSVEEIVVDDMVETPIIVDEYTATDKWMAINPLTTCTISIEGLKDEPIVTTPENQNDYLRKDIFGEYLISGTLFTAYDAVLGETNVTTVFGHSMENGSMFGTLKNYKSLEYLKKNPTFTMTSANENYNLKIVGVADVANNYVNLGWYFQQSTLSEKEFNKFEKEVRTRSYFVIPDAFNYDAKYVLLCTCDYAFLGERLIIVARIMEEGETFDVQEYTKNDVVLRADEFYTTYGKSKPNADVVEANYIKNYN